MEDDGLTIFGNVWRENMPLQSLDYTKDPAVRAAVFVFYRDEGNNLEDSMEVMVGCDEQVSAFTLIGILEDAKLLIKESCLQPGREED